MNQNPAVIFALLLGLYSHGRPASAGLPVADVSVSVVVAPDAFGPLSTGVIELTLHNDGPDPAGAVYPGSLGNLIAQRAFLLTQPSQRAPYQVLPGVTGCNIFGQLVGPNINMMWGYIWTYHYPPIPAGESRTCRIPIQFPEQPFESFDTSWRISTNPEDPDLTNNVVNYRFVAGVPLQPARRVPAFGFWAKSITALGLFALAARVLKRRDHVRTALRVAGATGQRKSSEEWR
jgi:hypothetical protein